MARLEFPNFLHSMVFFVFSAVLLFSAHAYAVDDLESYKKPLPELEMLSDEEYKEKYVVYDEEPLGDEALAYEIGIPLDWEKITDGGMSTFLVNSKMFGEVARFYGPSRLMGQRSRLTVEVLGLDYQLSAEQWFLQYLLSSGYSIQSFETIDEGRAEALYVLIHRRISYIVRAKVWINGSRIFLAQQFLPIDNWNEGKVEQAHMIKSFSLKNKDDELVEEMTSYRFLDIAQVHYPNSWILRAQPMRSIDKMSARILNISSRALEDGNVKFLDGRIDVKLVSIFSTESLDGEIEAYKKDIEKSGVFIRDAMDIENSFEFHDLVEESDVLAFMAVDSNKASLNYELQLAILTSGEYYYFISLLTPTREDEFAVWSRNTQSYKLILEHLEPLGETLLDRE